MADIPPWALANAVTGFATLFAGLTVLVLTNQIRPQPTRWILVYWSFVLSGIFTITLHTFGEMYGGPGDRRMWGVLDTGSNLVVVWALFVGVLGDYYTATLQRRAGGLAALLVGVTIGTMWLEPADHTARPFVIELGPRGGFYLGETVLIALALVVAGLFYFRRDMIPRAARPLLGVTIGIFTVGLLLAIPSNGRVDYPFFAYQALWHLVGAFGCVVFWAFNHVRFAPAT